MAVMLLDKTVSFKAAHDIARMKDPAVLRERAKVQLVPDDELEKLMPQRTAIVEVTLTDGRTVRERVGTVRGTTANPMTKDEVIARRAISSRPSWVPRRSGNCRIRCSRSRP